MPYQATAYYHPLPPTAVLSPLQTTLLVLALLLASLHALGYSVLAPRASAAAIHEMATFKLSQLAETVGLQGLGKATDWSKVERREVEGGKAPVRRYKDTEQGKASGDGLELYPGLLNVSGNLCFLNATLQSMASLPSLISYLQSFSDLVCDSEIRLPPTPVADSLLDTLIALNKPSTSRPSPLRPVALASALANSNNDRRRLLASSEQQDSHELWIMLREAVEEEVGRVDRVLREARDEGLGEVLQLAGKVDSVDSCLPSAAPTPTPTPTSLPKDPYLFLTSQRVKCMTCGYTRDVRHTSDQQVPLSVPAIAHVSLYALFREHTKMDLLSDYCCRRCSVGATMDKLVAQRDRLSLVNAETAPSSPATSKRSSTLRSSTPTGNNSFDLPPHATPSPTMTHSRKDRLRKTQKLVDRLQGIIDANDWERDLSVEFGDKVKLERVEGPAGKEVRFARSPEILTLHLSRSTYYSSAGALKNTCQVAFPELLDLSPFTDHPPPSSSSSPSSPTAHADVNGINPTSQPAAPTTLKAHRDLYRLSSLVVHYGSHHFGHYVAFRRRPSPPSPSPSPSFNKHEQAEWYRISDETVSPSTLAEVLRGNPFLLFYERWRAEVGEEGWSGVGEEGRGARGVEARVVQRWGLGGDSKKTAGDEPEGDSA